MIDRLQAPHHDRLQHAASAARDLLAHARTGRWEVFAKASTTREVEVRTDGDLQVVHCEETGVAVRTSGDGTTGFAAASGLESEAARRAADGARACTTACPVDPLPEARLLGVSPTHQPNALPPQGWAAHAAAELARCLAGASDGRLKLYRTVLQEGSFSWILTSSDGHVATHSDCRSSILAEVMVSGARSGIWREWLDVPQPESLDPQATANQVCDRALLSQAEIGSNSGTFDVLLHGEVSAHLVASLVPLFVASPERADPLPAMVDRNGLLASPCFGLVDDRTSEGAPVGGPCDGEGLAARRNILLEHGVPRHRLASYRDAILCGEAPRGGAVRLSYRDQPTSGISSLLVTTDEGTPPGRLLGSVDQALYLLRPLTPAAIDIEARSYRLSASGVWLSGGRITCWQPVVEIHGSIPDLLRRIDGVGTDHAWYQTDRGFIRAPTLLIRQQSVVG